jgi:hypothetical protein
MPGTLHTDRNDGIQRFINGGLRPDGRCDRNGMSDIKVFLMKTTTMKAYIHHPSHPRHWLADQARRTTCALALSFLVFVSLARADGDEHQRRHAPELPTPVCDSLAAPAGNRVSSHVYALGVQIYRWNGSDWVFIAPEAALFADSCYARQVGTHYAGPTWEANDGSMVMAARLDGCTPYRGAIPWLLLGTTLTSEHGSFARVTYIQRVNTIGGTAPAEAGAFVGDEAHVPYTAEYYFYTQRPRRR